MIRKEDVFKIGRIGKPHGVKGELTFAYDDGIFGRNPEGYLILDIDGLLVPFFMDSVRMRGSHSALVSFSHIDTVEKARPLVGCDVYYPLELAEADGEGLEWASLTGFYIVDAADGATVGTVGSVDDTTMNILFCVDLPDGGQMLLPAGDDLVEDIDIATRTITMILPEGIKDI